MLFICLVGDERYCLVGDERCLFDRDMGVGIGRIESRPPIDSMGVGIGLIESRPPIDGN